ncbi:MAG: SRPBCC domain-containing protein [Bacillota bacterium]
MWRALTDPSELNRWLTRSASLDLRVGGRIAPRLRLERSRSRLDHRAFAAGAAGLRHRRRIPKGLDAHG